MYKYEWDADTGGLLLLPETEKMSLEPRPVYYRELDILGFDKYWNYEKDDSAPLMWATANNYVYRGRIVAKTKGGALYTPPALEIIEEPEKNGAILRPVDIPSMTAKNAELMETLEQDTIQRIYNTYRKYKSKVDVFYVAFSGGKDSVVTLDLVQRALPHNEFLVLFGDTGMEFPDTYDVIKETEKWCEEREIRFYTARSHFNPLDSWKLFGPPASVSRWCCSVHKTAPQILLLRKILKKANFKGMAYVGVRGSESLTRSKYDFISYGGKHQGQYSCNAILEWNSAEIYLSIYKNDLLFNETYKKGNRRAGCLICPGSTDRNEFIKYACYKEKSKKYIDIIKEMYKSNFVEEDKLKSFLNNAGWRARSNGRDISIVLNYRENVEPNGTRIIFKKSKPNLFEWMKIIGDITQDKTSGVYNVNFNGNLFKLSLKEKDNENYSLFIDKITTIENPLFVKLLKIVIRRASVCVECQECEANCPNGYISFSENRVEISDKCTHCLKCTEIEKGCLRYKSLEMPKGGMIVAGKVVSLNTYSTHAPKMEWIKQYFELKNDFDDKHTLGSQMYSFFKRFLRHANLADEHGFSHTADIIDNIGVDNLSSWGIILVNISYAPQLHWFMKKFGFENSYSRPYIVSELVDSGVKENTAGDIIISLGRMMELPLGEIGLGKIQKKGRNIIGFKRERWQNPDPRVILYSLYKYAEAIGDIRQFTLASLLDDTIERDGVSPTRIFGLDRETMMPLLNGLDANYPDFISVSFTLDMDSISLQSDKKAEDVLELF